MSNHKILQDYDSNLSNYKAFEIKMVHLVTDLLGSQNIHVHSITARVKEKISLEKKISVKNKYKTLDQITDIVGLRIVTFFEDEVDIVAKLIGAEFEVDWINSVDKRVIEYDKFGYSSLHYVVTVNRKRSELLEYKAYKNQKLEIQIRSILQHAWAEIEHDIGYKSKGNIPDIIKRNFSRVAALLETSDLEFTKLRLKLNDYQQEVEQEISKNPNNVDINDISLSSYITSSKLVNDLDKIISEKTKTALFDPGDGIDTGYIPRLEYLNILNINELALLLEKRQDEVVRFAELFNERDDDLEDGYFTKGISIFYLCYLLIAERNDQKEIENFVHKYWDPNDHNLAHELIDTYKILKSE